MSNSGRTFSQVTVVAGLLFASCAASAQLFDAVRLNAAAPGKTGGVIGAGALGTTRYQGSDEQRTLFVPVIEYQWANGWFAGFGNGVGYNFSKDSALQYGLRLTFDRGREESETTALSGMGDIKAKGEAGGFFNFNFASGVSLTSSLRSGSGNDNNGTIVDLGVAYSTKLNDRLRLSTGVTASWANSSYMQEYFGVTPAQSRSSRYAVYTPNASLRDTRLRIGLTYEVSPRISVTAGLTSSSLSDEAKRSPLVRQADTVSGLIILGYAF